MTLNPKPFCQAPWPTLKPPSFPRAPMVLLASCDMTCWLSLSCRGFLENQLYLLSVNPCQKFRLRAFEWGSNRSPEGKLYLRVPLSHIQSKRTICAEQNTIITVVERLRSGADSSSAQAQHEDSAEGQGHAVQQLLQPSARLHAASVGCGFVAAEPFPVTPSHRLASVAEKPRGLDSEDQPEPMRVQSLVWVSRPIPQSTHLPPICEVQ